MKWEYVLAEIMDTHGSEKCTAINLQLLLASSYRLRHEMKNMHKFFPELLVMLPYLLVYKMHYDFRSKYFGEYIVLHLTFNIQI